MPKDELASYKKDKGVGKTSVLGALKDSDQSKSPLGGRVVAPTTDRQKDKGSEAHYVLGYN